MNPVLGVLAFLIDRIPAQLCVGAVLFLADLAWAVWTYRGLMR